MDLTLRLRLLSLILTLGLVYSQEDLQPTTPWAAWDEEPTGMLHSKQNIGVRDEHNSSFFACQFVDKNQN